MSATNYKAGDVVWTTYGAGVVLAAPHDGFYRVSLWRLPGRSLGSSASATLQKAAIVKSLPAAPGMITTMQPMESASEQPVVKVLLHCYRVDEDAFLVSRLVENEDDIDEDDTTQQLSRRRRRQSSITQQPSSDSMEELELIPSHRLRIAPAAKFYPVLTALMQRGDQVATQTAKVLVSGGSGAELPSAIDAQNLADQTQKTLQSVGAHVQSNLVPQADQTLKQTLTLIKDRELTDLLAQCRERLEQLVHTDLSQTTKDVLAQAGVQFAAAEDENPVLQQSRQALEALTKMVPSELADQTDWEKVRQSIQPEDLTKNVSAALESLATVANTDESLHGLFQQVAAKTMDWQEATGRVMQTRSANLFLEGAGRLQSRAMAILQQNQAQLQIAGEIGSKLTKSFSEGDAALARLKSIELGDAVKDRLVEAIEVRSESVGGLDGIIAGALTNLQNVGAGDHLKNMLSGLQSSASSAASDAHETLISVLSNRSRYQDAALLRLEQSLCDLEQEFADDVTPEELAAMVRGEGGTAKLFEPIARRAMSQIDSQLSMAESQVKDQTVLEVLSRIRKIMSGELTLSALTDDVVNLLNDKNVVSAGEHILVHGENVLDVLEGVSANNALNDALQIAAKAGITTDTVMKEIEKINVNEIIDTAGSAVTDEKARRQLLSSATDTALDFILRILPSMPVPPFEGVREGLVYQISNLSMEGFKVKKEDIQIELAGLRATKRARAASVVRVENSDGTGDDIKEFDNLQIQPSLSMDSTESTHSVEVEGSAHAVKATELLIIDVRRISAILDDAAWSFEQTYMPYLKGTGTANVRMSDGSIRLQFELRKTRKEDSTSEEVEWEPVLCLHERSCSIEGVELSLNGEGRLTWIFNKLAAIFKGPLRDYVVRTIQRVLSDRSGWILERLNGVLSPYWDLILRTAHLSMDDLVEVDSDVVLKQVSEQSTRLELVWRERLPLGMNLLMNDESGMLKVVDFPRGSQARMVCESRQLTPELFKGATVVGVNGTEYDEIDDLFDALKDPSRPKTVLFELAESEEVERLRRFVEGSQGRNKSDHEAVDRVREFASRDVTFEESGELGILFGNAPDDFGMVVDGFLESHDGIVFLAERSGMVHVGDLLTHVNGEAVVGYGGKGRELAATKLAGATTRPLTLTFVEPYIHAETIVNASSADAKNFGGPSELKLEKRSLNDATSRICIRRFENISGVAESDGVMIGDLLVFINGMPVGAGCRWLDDSYPPALEDVLAMFENKSSYPIGLTFARPKQRVVRSWSPTKGPRVLNDNDVDTFCVTAEEESRIGCVFATDVNSDIVVGDFSAVPGIFQAELDSLKDEDGSVHLSIVKVDGQFVPTYASVNMMSNALMRSWKTNKKVDLLLCDDERKEWVHTFAKSS